jgi:hypothetical protein
VSPERPDCEGLGVLPPGPSFMFSQVNAPAFVQLCMYKEHGTSCGCPDGLSLAELCPHNGVHV